MENRLVRSNLASKEEAQTATRQRWERGAGREATKTDSDPWAAILFTMVMVGVVWTWLADLAAAVGFLGDPVTNRASIVVVAAYLIVGIDRTTAGQVTNNPLLAVGVCAGGGGSQNTENSDDGKKSEQVFHGR